MTSEASLPEPGSLRVAPAPHWHGMSNVLPITAAFLVAAGLAHVAGLALFGWAALRVLAMSVASALLVGSLAHQIAGRRHTASDSQALLVGALFACTMPPGVAWHIPVIGAATCVLVGDLLLGGVGNYLWNPVAVGRVITQMLFADALSPERWPVLARGRLFWGNVELAEPLPALSSWTRQPVPEALEAWLVSPPIQYLQPPMLDERVHSGPEAVATLLRDLVPPWSDTLFGTAGGTIGAACGLAVVLGALVLAWRGVLRGSLALAGLSCAALCAAVLPVRFDSADGVQAFWLPGSALWEGWPTGLAYVAYQLTAGDLLLVLLLLAPDPSSSPLTSRGHLVFGALVGAGAMLGRVLIGLPAAPYWALLAANTVAPLIDRVTRRRVMGT